MDTTTSPIYRFKTPVFAKIYLTNGKTYNVNNVIWTSNEGRFMMMGRKAGEAVLVNSDNVNIIRLDDEPIQR